MSISDLNAELNDALIASDILTPCVVTVQTASGPPWDPVLTPHYYDCLGWLDGYSTADRGLNSNILAGDIKIFLLASSLPDGPDIANAGVSPTIDIYNLVGLRVISVQGDAAAVTYECQCRV